MLEVSQKMQRRGPTDAFLKGSASDLGCASSAVSVAATPCYTEAPERQRSVGMRTIQHLTSRQEQIRWPGLYSDFLGAMMNAIK